MTAHPGSEGALARRVQHAHLPLLPTVAARLARIDYSAAQALEQVVALAEIDPGLAMRVLRAANAAAFAPTVPVASLREAVAHLGTEECARLASAPANARSLAPRTAGEKNLWLHAVGVAVGMRHLARRPPGLASPNHAYAAGLLHDVGRFVMFEDAADGLRCVDETRWNSPDGLLRTERELLGHDHMQLGSLLCHHWYLPEVLAETVRWHHADAIPETLGGEAATLVRFAQFADRVSIAILADPAIVEASPPVIAGALGDRTMATAAGPPLHLGESGVARELKSMHAEALRLLGTVPELAQHEG